MFVNIFNLSWLAWFGRRYVVVLSGAQSLADGFKEGSLIGLINWADVALGIAAKGELPVLRL